MVHSTNGDMSTFAHLVHSIPDYSELIIAFLILLLLLMSMDEIMEFFHMVKDMFIFRSMPFD